MKLRLDNKTVRFRLSKDEIVRLQADGYLEEKIAINEDNQIVYVIDILDDLESCSLNFDEEGIHVGIPFGLSEKWINSNQIGIQETFDADDGSTITLIIEENLPPRKSK